MRDLTPLTKESFDLIIIGGGVTGAATLWEASLRGLKCLLLERGDYGQATSSATSKMAHGGLRYLKMLDFALVRESLRERRMLQEIAPHQVRPLDFLLPTYKDFGRHPAFLWLAMTLYEGLSFDKHHVTDPDGRLHPFTRLNSAEVREKEPLLPTKDLRGGYIYQDCQINFPERVVLSYIQGAKAKGAEAENYTKVLGLIKVGSQVKGVKVLDLETNQELEFFGTTVINATGPWAAETAKMAGPTHIPHPRSKGIHIVTPKKLQDSALAFFTKAGQHLFFLPWEGYNLIGTTDEVYDGRPDDLEITEPELEGYIKRINQSIPDFNLQPDEVLLAYTGIRPLAAGMGGDSYHVSRKHVLINHSQDGAAGFFSATGGKFTTSRGLAFEAVNLLLENTNLKAGPSASHTAPLQGGDMECLALYKKKFFADWPQFEQNWLEKLVHHYGTDAPKLAKIALAAPLERVKLSNRGPLLQVELTYAVEEEQAKHLSDFVFRRSGLGTLEKLSSAELGPIAAAMGAKLGWNEEQKSQEINKCLVHFKKGIEPYGDV
ncbi:MAG: glycerol-3-phosphate dehydrogenase/oxidase [SAR324 cluster bacterium]|nr:glycerol-3-phosphate dehydrogenase/oxidase [SAR324 cluster bacterium]